jgi:hypothetical protein
MRKYVFPYTMIMTLLLAIFFFIITQDLKIYERAIVEDKLEAQRVSVDIIADMTENYIAKDQDWGTYDYLQVLNKTFEQLDTETGIFAAVYSIDLDLLSSRYPDNIAFDPTDSEEFRAQIVKENQGEVSLKYGDSNMLLYYRWVPVYGTVPDSLLFVTGIARNSIYTMTFTPINILIYIFGLGFAIMGLIPFIIMNNAKKLHEKKNPNQSSSLSWIHTMF